MNVLVTGSAGFIGSNLCVGLKRAGYNVLMFERENTDQELRKRLAVADFVYHLAGVNRPEREEEFQEVNVGLTARICEHLLSLGRATPIVFTSSVQVMLNNPYGRSKRRAQKVLLNYTEQSGARITVYTLPNVFGKWCRPNYNSVVATFCHNIARDLRISVRDPEHVLELVYIDDVVRHFIIDLDTSETGDWFCLEATPVHTISVMDLAELLFFFHEMRRTLRLPDMGDEFTRKLYSTYLSYLEPNQLIYALDKKCDDRGCLAEFVKSASAGQVFVSRTVPGAVRGGHYHDTKTEKFLVLEGHAIIRFRHVLSGETWQYGVFGEGMDVIDVPPGCSHYIENVGSGDLITLFWVSAVFDPQNPDTYRESV